MKILLEKKYKRKRISRRIWNVERIKVDNPTQSYSGEGGEVDYGLILLIHCSNTEWFTPNLIIFCVKGNISWIERGNYSYTKYFPHSAGAVDNPSSLILSPRVTGAGLDHNIPLDWVPLIKQPNTRECRRHRDTLRLRPWRRRGWVISLTRCWMSIKYFAPPWQSCQQIFP